MYSQQRQPRDGSSSSVPQPPSRAGEAAVGTRSKTALNGLSKFPLFRVGYGNPFNWLDPLSFFFLLALTWLMSRLPLPLKAPRRWCTLRVWLPTPPCSTASSAKVCGVCRSMCVQPLPSPSLPLSVCLLLLLCRCGCCLCVFWHFCEVHKRTKVAAAASNRCFRHCEVLYLFREVRLASECRGRHAPFFFSHLLLSLMC